MWFDTRDVVITSGSGVGSSEIVAFDAALRDAQIAEFNLIRVTSIVPPHVPVHRLVKGEDDRPLSGEGQMLPAVYAKAATDRAGERMTAAVGVGVPEDRDRSGVIFVNEAVGGPAGACVDELERMVSEGMKTLRRTDAFAFHEASATTTAAAGLWSCTVAALCFVDEGLWPYFGSRIGPV